MAAEPAMKEFIPCSSNETEAKQMSILKQAKTLGLVAAMLAAGVVSAPAQADDAGYTIFTRGFIESLQTPRMMDMMDGNKDHKVTRDEFMAYQSRLFEMMDNNRDGIVDLGEWTARLGGIGGKGTS